MDGANGRAGAGTRAIVVGAGIVGVSVALHLQRRGLAVTLIDRNAPGEATSYGNAGVVERDGVVPITFPSSLSALAAFALNRTSAAHYHLAALPAVWPWLMALRRASGPQALAAYAAASSALEALALPEHKALAGPAGAAALFRETGWLRLFRTEAGFREAERTYLPRAAEHGIRLEALTPEAVTAELEPSLSPRFHAAVFSPETASVASPGEVTKAYARLFAAEGGRIATGEVTGLCAAPGGGWRVALADGAAHGADVAVVAAGPWAMDLLAPLGYRLPLAVKRGYHRHYRPVGNASLARPVVDMEKGFVITPMKDGIRLTTGIEFARRDARPTPVQLSRAHALAEDLFPLGEAVEDAPWMGARPCFPDSLPVIGPAPRHPGLWLAIGHGHLGFTEGPVTGRLLSEMMTGAPTVVDPRPYRADRFSG